MPNRGAFFVGHTYIRGNLFFVERSGMDEVCRYHFWYINDL